MALSLVCLSHDSFVRVNAGSAPLLICSQFCYLVQLATKVVVIVLAPRKRLWCWQSPAAPGKEACAQADWEELDRGRSGELAGVVGEGCFASGLGGAVGGGQGAGSAWGPGRQGLASRCSPKVQSWMQAVHGICQSREGALKPHNCMERPDFSKHWFCR